MASEDLLKKAVAAFNALSPEQQAEMMEEQRQSWVRGNVGLSRDERGITSPMMRALKIVRDTNDKGRQALQAWADSKTRPTPVAPVSPDATGKCVELETTGYMRPEDLQQSSFWVSANQNAYYREPVCFRSQAAELLAAKDDKCKDLESTLTAWFNTKKITEDSLKPLMIAAVKGYLRTCSSGGMPQKLIDDVLPAVEGMIDSGVFAESVTQYTMSLKSDNAALTARVKRLEELEKYTVPIHADGSHVFIDGPGDVELDHGGKMRQRIKALETQLAAAEKIRIAAIELDAAISDDFNIFGAQQKLRAALGGKPS